MAKHNHVPQFGQWNNDDQVPYTIVFDNARAQKGGKPMNPNEPTDLAEMFGEGGQKDKLPESKPFEYQFSDQNDDYLRPPPSQEVELPAHKTSQDYNRRDGSARGGAAYQGRLGNKNGSVSGDGGTMPASGSYGRSTLHGNTKADETPERGSALPKFGAWNEQDPDAGENYTIIFNQARNEKKTGGNLRVAESPARTPGRIKPSLESQSKQNSGSQGPKMF